MAHYITADGRIQSFEAEVRPDGNVRPKNYHEFDSDDSSGENPRHSAEPLIDKYEKKRNKPNGIDKSVLTKLSENIISYIVGTNLSQQGKNYLITMFLPCNTMHPSAKSIKKLQAKWSIPELAIMEETINYLNKLVAKQVIGHNHVPAKVHLTANMPTEIIPSIETPIEVAESSTIQVSDDKTDIKNDIKLNNLNLQIIKKDVKKYILGLKLTELGKSYLKSLFMPCKIVTLSEKAITKLQATWINADLAILETAINELNDLLIIYYPDSAKPNKVSLTKNLPILEGKNAKISKKALSSSYDSDIKHKQEKTLEQTKDLKTNWSKHEKHGKPNNKEKSILDIKLKLNKHCLEIIRNCNHTEEQLIKAVDKLIAIPGFSRKANSLLLGLVHKRVHIEITQKLLSRIEHMGLASEEENIIYTIKVYNNLIKNYIITDNKKLVRSKEAKRLKNHTKQKTIQPTISDQNHHSGTDTTFQEKEPVGKEWVSGNYVRKGPQPKYGYARDRFGRVQERDSYREDIDVNPYSSYSSYDSEDDHDSQNILD